MATRFNYTLDDVPERLEAEEAGLDWKTEVRRKLEVWRGPLGDESARKLASLNSFFSELDAIPLEGPGDSLGVHHDEILFGSTK